MKYMLILLITSWSFTSQSQDISWYFDSPVFKEWIIKNQVRSLLFESPIPNLREIEEMNSPTPSTERIGYEFYFDKTGELDSFASKYLTVSLSTDTNQRYASLFDASIPRRFSEVADRLKPYGGTSVLKDFQHDVMNYLQAPDGVTWYDRSLAPYPLLNPEIKGEYQVGNYYTYHLIQAARLEKGSPTDLKDILYIGDAWNIRYQHTVVEMIGDSLETAKKHITYYYPQTFEESLSRRERDSIFTEQGYLRINPQTNIRRFGYNEHGTFRELWNVEEKNVGTERVIRYQNYPNPIDDDLTFYPKNSLFSFSETSIYSQNPIYGFYLPKQEHWKKNAERGLELEIKEHFKKGKFTGSEAFITKNSEKKLFYKEKQIEHGRVRYSGSNSKSHKAEIHFKLIGDELEISLKESHYSEKRTKTLVRTSDDTLYFSSLRGSFEDEIPMRIVRW